MAPRNGMTSIEESIRCNGPPQVKAQHPTDKFTMHRLCTFATLFALLVISLPAIGQQDQNRTYPPTLEGARVEVYKTIGDVKLNMYIFAPEGHKPTDKRPAAVFFFGGGWHGGTPKQFESQCKYLASRGIVAMAADYRVASRHHTKAIACVSDAKSAVRWIRRESARLGVDGDRIVAGGGSAGGHIAACTGTIDKFDEPDEDLSLSSKPNAMALFNPASVLAPIDGREPFNPERTAELTARLGVDPEEISPLHHVKPGTPPTILFHGTGDAIVKFWTAEAFAAAMKGAGNRCDLQAYDDQPHGFFNYGRGGNKYYDLTTKALDEFLVSLGYLPEP